MFVDQHGGLAAQLACEWYDMIRAQELDSVDGYTAKLPIDEVLPPEQIRASIRWKAGVLFGENQDYDAMASFLATAVDRWMRTFYREAMVYNVNRDPKCKKFAIVPVGMCCAYCGMLASRDFVYHSEESARNSVHDHCDCQIVPSWGRKYEQLVIQGYDPSLYKQAYEKAVEASKQPLSKDAQLAVKQYVRGEYQQDMKRTLKAVNKGTADLSDERTLTSLMRYSSPNLFTDGVYPDGERMSTTAMSMWKAYRRDAFAHFLEVGSPRDGKLIPVKPAVAPPMPVDGPQLTDKQWNHILYGNTKWIKNPKTSRKTITYAGGHLYGYGWVNKSSQFPSTWTEENIYEALVEVIETGEKYVIPNGQTCYTATIKDVKLVAYVSKNKINSFYPRW